jgi:hypothetical protein
VPFRDELCFVQFLHPGKEHRPDRNGFKDWNRKDHRRKFVEIDGQCVKNGKRLGGLLRFWAEWEPQSNVVTQITDPVTDGPEYVYNPFYVVPRSYRNLQNTDPFVFGSFFYTGCQQNTERGSTQLRYLSRASVILFGSCVSGQFAIDTVFVVDKFEDHDKRSVQKLRNHLPEVYWSVTLAAWYQESRDDSCPSSCKPFESWRLYYGATVDSPVNGMYSFFPCCPAQESPVGFARPAIAIPGLITDGLLQGKKLNKGVNLESVKQHWDDVCNKVQSAGLSLGVYAETPVRQDVSLLRPY